MRTAFLVLLGCAALDLIAIVVLLSIVWVLHRQMRKEAAARGDRVGRVAVRVRFRGIDVVARVVLWVGRGTRAVGVTAV